MRSSIRQVASAAGVSAMTVSNVLRGRDHLVADETRVRVLEAVHRLDYVPVRMAAQNRHVKTSTLGVVFLHLHRLDGIVGYPTFLGMSERARQVDHDLTVFLRSEPDWVRPGMEAQFLDRRCDGFIFVGYNDPAVSEVLVRHQVPAVECYSVAPLAGVARVLGNNTDGMRQAVRHLAQRGHERIAHLAGPRGNLEAQERLDGFRAGMQETFGADYRDRVVQGDTWGGAWRFHEPWRDAGSETRALAEAVLAMNVTAVVCANDLLALAVWQLAEERGLRVPQDLSLIGMDNILPAACKGLTSIATPFAQIGAGAVDAVLALQCGEDSQTASRILPVALEERNSVSFPSK